MWILLLLLVGALLSSGFFTPRILLLILAESFSGYLLPIALLGIVTSPWWGRASHWLISASCFALLVLGLSRHAETLDRFFIGIDHSPPAGAVLQPLRVVLANIGSENSNLDEAINLLRSADAQVIALLEVTDKTVERFNEEFPYRRFVEQSQGYGIGLVSRLPLAATVRSSIGVGVRPVAITAVTLPNGLSLPVVAFDAPVPFTTEAVEQTWLIIRRLGTFIRHELPSALVLTDLNAPPFSRFYRVFSKEAELVDAWWGRGMVRTWDLTRWWMRFQIDHVFVKNSVYVRRAAVVDIPGSDHRALVVDIEVPDGA